MTYPITWQDLLDEGACLDALNFVQIDAQGDLNVAWQTCTRVDWMIWLLEHFPNPRYVEKYRDLILWTKSYLEENNLWLDLSINDRYVFQYHMDNLYLPPTIPRFYARAHALATAFSLFLLQRVCSARTQHHHDKIIIERLRAEFPQVPQRQISWRSSAYIPAGDMFRG